MAVAMMIITAESARITCVLRKVVVNVVTINSFIAKTFFNAGETPADLRNIDKIRPLECDDFASKACLRRTKMLNSHY